MAGCGDTSSTCGSLIASISCELIVHQGSDHLTNIIISDPNGSINTEDIESVLLMLYGPDEKLYNTFSFPSTTPHLDLIDSSPTGSTSLSFKLVLPSSLTSSFLVGELKAEIIIKKKSSEFDGLFQTVIISCLSLGSVKRSMFNSMTLDSIANANIDFLVKSFSGRYGDVIPQFGDYSSEMISVDNPNFIGNDLNTILTEIYNLIKTQNSMAIATQILLDNPDFTSDNVHDALSELFDGIQNINVNAIDISLNTGTGLNSTNVEDALIELNESINNLQVFSSKADATLALGTGKNFRWSEDNTDGVPSPDDSSIGTTD